MCLGLTRVNEIKLYSIEVIVLGLLQYRMSKKSEKILNFQRMQENKYKNCIIIP